MQPLQSEYPRKDWEGVEPNFVKNCYLTKLLQDSTQETWEHLLQPDREKYDCQTKSISYHNCFANNELSVRNEQRFAFKKYSREDMIKILQPYLFDPLPCGRSAITVLPVNVYYDNVDTQKPIRNNFPNTNVTFPLEECRNLNRARWISPEKNKSKYDILRKLLEFRVILNPKMHKFC